MQQYSLQTYTHVCNWWTYPLNTGQRILKFKERRGANNFLATLIIVFTELDSKMILSSHC